MAAGINSTLTNTISHIETVRNTVTPFYSHFLVFIQIAQIHNQLQRNICLSIFSEMKSND